jgi:hypothetical protein
MVDSTVASTRVDRHAPTQVRQSETSLAIASVDRAEQAVERLILTDWKDLAIAESPTPRCEVEAHDAYFG